MCIGESSVLKEPNGKSLFRVEGYQSLLLDLSGGQDQRSDCVCILTNSFISELIY